jgi:hypothetical protein
MTTLHIVTNLSAGFSREDRPSAAVAGAFFDPNLAADVRKVAGHDSQVIAIEIGHVHEGHRQSMHELGIRALAPAPDGIPLATLQDVLNVESEDDFELLVAELPGILRALRSSASIDGHSGFAWPIRWRAEGEPSTLTTHCTDGCVTQPLNVAPAATDAAVLLESSAWRHANAARLAACWSAFDGYPTHKLVGKPLAEIVSNEAYIYGMGPAPEGGLELKLHGMACQLLANAFAGEFVSSGAVNFIEVGMEHDDVGPMTVTIQRVQGKTPGTLRAETMKELAEANAKLETMEDFTARLKERITQRDAMLTWSRAMSAEQRTEFFRLADRYASSTVDTPRRAQELQRFVETMANPIQLNVAGAVAGYLRTCRSGGMLLKDTIRIQAAVDDAQRLGYFDHTSALVGPSAVPEMVELSFNSGKLWERHDDIESARSWAESFPDSPVLFRGLYAGPEAVTVDELSPPLL